MADLILRFTVENIVLVCVRGKKNTGISIEQQVRLECVFKTTFTVGRAQSSPTFIYYYQLLSHKFFLMYLFAKENRNFR